MNETLYKITSATRGPVHGGSGDWPDPGQWRSVEGALEPCKNGLHLCREGDLTDWLKVDAVVWRVEHERADNEYAVADNKVVVRHAALSARVGVLTERVLRTLAVECAERVLPIYEKQYPKDSRVRKCIEAVRGYLAGTVTMEQLAAANAAVYAAANAAAYAAYAADAAAYAAAYAAANAAVYAAAYAAAYAAYAADAAANAAANAAAYAAYAAYAANAAANAAADAAYAELRAWAGRRLIELLETAP